MPVLIKGEFRVGWVGGTTARSVVVIGGKGKGKPIKGIVFPGVEPGYGSGLAFR